MQTLPSLTELPTILVVQSWMHRFEWPMTCPMDSLFLVLFATLEAHLMEPVVVPQARGQKA